ncbi:uncharacterized protein COLE_03602 [Cutaneotrichosporon oleaginosum]|uniref:uncharacterized protein n=1 Tax=Cutaneotrichosporon oleaginosum TaxID=879819 RepID=UPI00132BBDBD|nr:hypothetical protein COLE_03602 [Cutaneotrichosporon oleaginosum]
MASSPPQDAPQTTSKASEPGPSVSSLPFGYGAKRKRISDRCNKLGRKCLPGSDKMCQSCVDYGDECTYDRPKGKRGVRRRFVLIDSTNSRLPRKPYDT